MHKARCSSLKRLQQLLIATEIAVGCELDGIIRHGSVAHMLMHAAGHS